MDKRDQRGVITCDHRIRRRIDLGVKSQPACFGEKPGAFHCQRQHVSRLHERPLRDGLKFIDRV